MGLKSILSAFKTNYTNKDYKHKSLLLNIDLLPDEKLKIELYHSADLIAKGKSRIKITDDIRNKFTEYIDRICNCTVSAEPIQNIQKELSGLTDDIIPKKISDFLVNSKSVYKYIAIEDESLHINIPYGILFFPDPSVKDCLSNYGFFLSEYYTIARAEVTTDVETSIESMFLLSTEDLGGSVKEERVIYDYVNAKAPGKVVCICSKDDLEKRFTQRTPQFMHFCCHGDEDCNILFVKNGVQEILDTSFFSLYRFPDNSLIVLNICNSNYTIYNKDVPRSIANKLIDRNGGLVVVTEWPINDNFAYAIGTNLYKSIENKKTMIQILSEVKEGARTSDEKITAIAYSLRGNPNLVVNL